MFSFQRLAKQRPLDSRMRMSTSTRFDLKFFRVLSKNTNSSLYFFSPEKLALLSILKEVETSPNCKMLKLLTFDNSPLQLKLVVGTLRSEDGDNRENVAEKVNSRSFNLHRDYSKSLTLSNVGEPS